MDKSKQQVFLDSNVIFEYLRGKPELRRLFAPEVESQVTFSVNPVVIQELLLALEPLGKAADVDALSDHLNLVSSHSIFESDVLGKLRHLRSTVIHPNDLLILGNAQDCDLLLTYDNELLNLREQLTVPITTPERFLDGLGVAA